MKALLGSLRKRFLGISPEETTFARRGFLAGGAGMRARLERIGRTFVEGYHAALENDRAAALAARLNAVEREFRGFAFEGAAMGLALLDFLTPWRRWRLPAFLDGAGDPHAYMIHVGAGWTMARLPGRLEPRLQRLDPLLRWLAMDGYGFHEGFFHSRRCLGAGQPRPRRVSGYAGRAFDQGLGRCLWFIHGAEVTRIPPAIAAFPASRQPDLWSGAGLACAYAGEADQPALRALWTAAGPFQPQLAQGAAFAAKARQRAGNPTAYTELAAQTLCGVSVAEAAEITDAALENLPSDRNEPAYEIWRCRVQARFTNSIKLP